MCSKVPAMATLTASSSGSYFNVGTPYYTVLHTMVMYHSPYLLYTLSCKHLKRTLSDRPIDADI